MRLWLALALALLLPPALLAQSSSNDLNPIQLQFHTGQYAAAVAALEARIKGDDKDLPARVLLARIQVETGKLKEADDTLAAALKLVPQDAGARSYLVELHGIRGRYREAIVLGNELLAADAANLPVRLALVDALLQTGEYEQAEKLLEYFFDYYNEHVNATPALTADQLYYIAQGVWEYGTRKGDKDSLHKAIESVLEDALKLDPNHADAFTFGGWCYAAKHDASHAKSWFEDALKINPNHAFAKLGTAACEGELDRKKAPPLIQEALELNPSLRDALIMAAEDPISKRDYDQALTILDKARDINPNHGETLGLIAACRLLKGDQKGFDEIAKKATEINAKPALFYYTVGATHTHRMLLDDGDPFLAKAVELDPHLWDAVTELGMNALRLGNDVVSKQRLDLATEKDPFNIWAMNTFRLLQAYKTEFSMVESPNYRLRFHNSERAFMEPYTVALAERVWKTMCERYHFTPQAPVVLEMFPNHGDLSVRTFGLGGLGILGACFGHVVVLDSPKAQEVHGAFNWGSVLWHEMAHVFALQISGNRVPRWFTEGLSTYEEKLGGWPRAMEMDIFRAWHAGSLAKLENMDKGDTGSGGDLLNYYLYGSLINEYIATQYGFDKIIRILQLYKAGKTTTEAFQEALGTDLTKLEANMGQYLKVYLEQIKMRPPLDQDKEKAIVAAMTAKPDDPEAMANYARVLLEKDKLADAQQAAERALEKDPKNLTATLVLGHLWNRKHPPRLKKAVEYLNKAIDLGADDYGTHFTLARAYHQLADTNHKTEDLDSAVLEYLAARKCFPRAIMRENSPSEFLLAIYKERQQGELYRKELEYLVGIAIDDCPHRMELAKIYRQEGKRDEMIKVLEAAIFIEPRDLRLHAYLAEGYKESSRPDDAVREYQVLVVLAVKANEGGKLDQRIADWYCEMAEIRLGQGKKDEAGKYLQEAQKVVPAFPRAKELRAKLE